MATPSKSAVSPLIVILLGLVLVAVLMASLVPRYGSRPPDRRHATLMELHGLKDAITTFHLDNGRCPTAGEGLAALLQAPPALSNIWHGPYIDREPLDQWGHAYRYVSPTTDHPDFNIISAGTDGQFGTEDDIDVKTQN